LKYQSEAQKYLHAIGFFQGQSSPEIFHGFFVLSPVKTKKSPQIVPHPIIGIDIHQGLPIGFSGLEITSMVVGAAQVKNYNTKADLSESIRKSWKQSVLAEVDTHSGKSAGCVFMGGDTVMGEVPMDWFGHAFSMLNRLIANGEDSDSPLYRGVYIGSANDLRCYTMLAGLKPPTTRLQELAKEGRVSKASVPGVADQLGVGDA
jgi:hypothetical protein